MTKMTWEETIIFIRKKPEFKALVSAAYLQEDIVANVESFRNSEEFKETKKILNTYHPEAVSLLDIGGGNGISSLAFALAGFEVTVSEPDPSETIGAGAIRKLKEFYSIKHLEVYEEFAENIQFQGKLFDVVYVRQAMHHAYDLNLFVKNLADLIKPGGILLTVRDHVIYNAADKQWFLDSHPLHQFYGGENAFTENEYRAAIEKSGLTILKILKHFDSIINYSPITRQELLSMKHERKRKLQEHLKKKIGIVAKLPFAFAIYKKKIGISDDEYLNEANIPGRIYSFIAQKKYD